jgi:hypothetical protein
MRFGRGQIVSHPFAGVDPATGEIHTTASVDQTAVSNLVLGNGAAHNIATSLDDNGNPVLEEITSIALPAAYNADATFELNINGNQQVFLHLHTQALGAAALTGVVALIEFQDPDYPDRWFPSAEGVARTANYVAHEQTLLGAGDWILASRVEHRQFTKVRFRFRAAGGAADAATIIVAGWTHDGGINLVNNDY